MQELTVKAPEDPIESSQQIVVRLLPGAYGLWIGVDGYTDSCSEDNGHFMLLEKWEGRLSLKVWANLKCEDPTHVIDLEGCNMASLPLGTVVGECSK